MVEDIEEVPVQRTDGEHTVYSEPYRLPEGIVVVIPVE